MSNLEEYFSEFRENIIGINQEFTSKFGTHKIIYTDWTGYPSKWYKFESFYGKTKIVYND